MNKGSQVITLGLFGLAFIAMFLPFVSASAQGLIGGSSVSLTAMRLVTGGSTAVEVTLQGGFGSGPESSSTSGQIATTTPAVIVLVAIIVGLGITLMRFRWRELVAAIAGGVGFIFVFLLKAKVDSDVLGHSSGIPHVSYEVGFYLLLLSLAAAAALNGYLAVTALKNASDHPAMPSGTVETPPSMN